MRETAAIDEIGNRFSGEREENVRACNTHDRVQLLLGDTADLENTGLVDFGKKCRVLAILDRDRDHEHDLVVVLPEHICLCIQVQAHVRFPFTEKGLWRVWRLERDVLAIDSLETELALRLFLGCLVFFAHDELLFL